MRFTCKVLDSQEQFLLYRKQWNQLVEQSQSPTYFMSWEWLDTWLSVYGEIADQLLIVLVFDMENKLVGAIPLYLVKGENASVSCQHLRFIGSGEEEWEEVSTEYLDVVTRPGTEDKVCQFLFNKLDTLGLSWDIFIVENILEDSIFLRKLVPILLGNSYNLVVNKSGQRYRISLPESWSNFEAGLGKSMRRKVRQSKKRIQEMEGYKTEETNNIELGLSELKALHGERWKKKNMAGAFSSPKFLAFHQQFMSRFLEDGKLRLRRTSIENDLIAILYNIRFAETESYYQSGFDLQLGSRVRPGIYAHMQAIEVSIEEKVKYYDMMKGSEDSYKADYRAEVVPMLTIQLYNRTPRGRLRYLRDISLRYARKLRDRYTLS